MMTTEKIEEPYLITYRHKDGTVQFQQWSNDPIPVWAVDIRKVIDSFCELPEMLDRVFEDTQ
jgi:hypothetical protein